MSYIYSDEHCTQEKLLYQKEKKEKYILFYSIFHLINTFIKYYMQLTLHRKYLILKILNNNNFPNHQIVILAYEVSFEYCNCAVTKSPAELVGKLHDNCLYHLWI